MKKLAATIFILSFLLLHFPQGKIPVFVSGTEGYNSFRTHKSFYRQYANAFYRLLSAWILYRRPWKNFI